MGKIIVITTNKGGTGKTTIASNLACSLSMNNKKVILIDIDPQCGINFEFGKDWNYSHRKTIINVAMNEIKLSDAIISANENLDLLLSDINLNNYDQLKLRNSNIEFNIKDIIKFLKDNYDYVIIDTAPQISSLNKICLELSDITLIPYELEQKSIAGAIAIISKLNEINPKSFNLLILNKCRINWIANEVRYSKVEKEIQNEFSNWVEQNSNNTIFSQAKMINSSQFKNIIFKKQLPLITISSNSKIYEKPKKCINDLMNIIINI